MTINPRGRSNIVAAEPIAVLRPLRQSDGEAIARWYDKAVVLAGERRSLGDRAILRQAQDERILSSARGEPVEPRAGNEAACLVVTSGDSQDPIGLLVVARDDPEDGWATVALLAIAAPEQRDLAAEGVALLETDLGQETTRIRAAVPADVGLALYFWLRLGYRPTAAGERLWMMRDLDA